MSSSTSRVGWMSLLALSAISCHQPVQANLGQPVDLLVKRAVRYHRSDLDLYFRRVVSDSRCPRGVDCVTAGEAVVTLEGRILKAPPESFEVRLPGGEAPDSAIWKPYDGYRIRLVKLEPYPVAGAPVDTTAYIGTFLIEKR